MNKTGWILGILTALIIVAALILFILPGKSVAPTTDSTSSQQATTTTATNPQFEDMLVVESLKNGATISSPLTITGKARGGWYFEASFPVEIKNASGTKIAEGPAQAQGEWMTQEYVPFSITLSFPAQQKGSVGTVILHNDNPSGLPENDRQLVVPIVF